MTDPTSELRERLYAMENEQHEVQRKWEKGEFRKSWLDPDGFTIDAYGYKWWLQIEEGKLSVRVII